MIIQIGKPDHVPHFIHCHSQRFPGLRQFPDLIDRQRVLAIRVYHEQLILGLNQAAYALVVVLNSFP